MDAVPQAAINVPVSDNAGHADERQRSSQGNAEGEERNSQARSASVVIRDDNHQAQFTTVLNGEGGSNAWLAEQLHKRRK